MGDNLLDGTWQAVRIEAGGQPVPPEAVRLLKYVFAGDRVTLVEGNAATGTGVITLAPGAITVRMEDGPGQGKVAEGLYRVEGDVLTLCIGEQRPTAFSGAGAAALIELVREAPSVE